MAYPRYASRGVAFIHSFHSDMDTLAYASQARSIGALYDAETLRHMFALTAQATLESESQCVQPKQPHLGIPLLQHTCPSPALNTPPDSSSGSKPPALPHLLDASQSQPAYFPNQHLAVAPLQADLHYLAHSQVTILQQFSGHWVRVRAHV